VRTLLDANGEPKTSIVFWGAGDGSPGWLMNCLAELADRGISLTRIESRPRRIGLGHYMFFADFEGAGEDPRVAAAIDGLRARCQDVRVLGSYRRG
jgi:prephenate dehydratase